MLKNETINDKLNMKGLIKNAVTVAAVERERERIVLNNGKKFASLFELLCALENIATDKMRKYIDKGRTMFRVNNIGLSLRVLEIINYRAGPRVEELIKI